jgi:hypothetical protein
MKHEASGVWSYGTLIPHLEAAGIEYLNVGEILAAHLQATGQGICDLYRRAWYAKGGCAGHFNAAANALVSAAVHERLTASTAAVQMTSGPGD